MMRYSPQLSKLKIPHSQDIQPNKASSPVGAFNLLVGEHRRPIFDHYTSPNRSLSQRVNQYPHPLFLHPIQAKVMLDEGYDTYKQRRSGLYTMLSQGLPESFQGREGTVDDFVKVIRFLEHNRSVAEQSARYSKLFDAFRSGQIPPAEFGNFVRASGTYYRQLGELSGTGAQSQANFRRALGIKNLRALNRSRAILSGEANVSLQALLTGGLGGGPGSEGAAGSGKGPSAIDLQPKITPIATIANPTVVGLEQENRGISFVIAGSDPKGELAATEAKALDNIPLLAVTYDTLTFKTPVYKTIRVLEVISGPSPYSDYEEGDFFQARDLLLEAFEAIDEENVLRSPTESPKTLRNVLERYQTSLELNQIDPRYQLTPNPKFLDVTFSINPELSQDWSTQVNISLPYEAIGDPNSGFSHIFNRNTGRAYPQIQAHAEQMANLIDPIGASANLKSLFTHLFFQEIQAAQINDPSRPFSFYSKEGSSYVIRASGEDIVSGVLSDRDVLALYQWVANNGISGALQQYTDALRQAAIATRSIIKYQDRLVGTDRTFTTRFEAIFISSVMTRIESNRHQLGARVDHTELRARTAQQGIPNLEDIKHFGIPDAKSRLPIREQHGRYYVVIEDRVTRGTTAQTLKVGPDAWELSDLANTVVRDILATQSFVSPTLEPEISRGQLLIEVLARTLQECPYQSISPALIHALQTENAQGGLGQESLVGRLLEQQDDLAHHPPLQAEYSEAVKVVLNCAPTLVIELDSDTQEALMTDLTFSFEEAFYQVFSQGLSTPLPCLPPTPEHFTAGLVEYAQNSQACRILAAQSTTLFQLLQTKVVTPALRSAFIQGIIRALSILPLSVEQQRLINALSKEALTSLLQPGVIQDVREWASLEAVMTQAWS